MTEHEIAMMHAEARIMDKFQWIQKYHALIADGRNKSAGARAVLGEVFDALYKAEEFEAYEIIYKIAAIAEEIND
jgi:hypothetical protein